MERALDELRGFEGENIVTDDNILIFQKGLERGLNGLQEEVRSSLTEQGRKATITGVFKVSIGRRGKLRCKIVAGDPDRAGSLVSAIIPKD